MVVLIQRNFLGLLDTAMNPMAAIAATVIKIGTIELIQLPEPNFFRTNPCTRLKEFGKAYVRMGKEYKTSSSFGLGGIEDFFNAIFEGYTSIRKIEESELNSFNLILRAATVRILITRLHDYIFHPSDALVVKKDPIQYYNILKWHQQNNIH